MKDEIAARLRAIRGRTEAATPGPWGWRGNKESKQITLFRLRAWGDVVMDFRRWGTQSAQPCFVTDGIIRKPTWKMGPPHHPWEIVGIDHPDARFIEHSREDVEYLLDVADAAEAFLGLFLADEGASGVDTCEAALTLLRAFGGETEGDGE